MMEDLLKKVRLLESEEPKETEKDEKEESEDDKEESKEDNLPPWLKKVKKEVKESTLTVKVQTISGRVGTKVFENRESALEWLNENSAKITKAALVEQVK